MLFTDFLVSINKDINEIATIRRKKFLFFKDKKPKFRYHIFILVGIGIEMLGAALDEYDWFKQKQSSVRFELALASYKSLKKYKDKKLYEHLRCGMCHVYVPNKDIAINCKSEGYNNLDLVHGKILIQMEDFLKDFKDACSELLLNIENKSNSLPIKDKNKLTRQHLSVPSDHKI